MGGPIAFRTAAAMPDRVGAVASFHGGGLVTDTPNSPHIQAAKSKAQFRFMKAAEKGDVKDGPSPKQAKEFTKGQSPKDLPEKKARKK